MSSGELDLTPILNRIPVEWGKWVRTGPGWHAIVLELDRQLAAIDPTYEILQVKEKFGGLRYYCTIEGSPEVIALISAAEEKAARTCEECGQPGELRNGVWVFTLCDVCHELKEEQRELRRQKDV